MTHATSIAARVASTLQVLLIALSAMSFTVRAQPYEDGTHYRTLDPPRPVADGAKVEVIEFFYYGCPVCYETQPPLTRWLAQHSGDVTLVRVPAVSNEAWANFARTFYALEAVGELSRLHWPLYDNHHFDGRRLDEEAKLLEWLGSNGVDAAQFRAIRNSDAVKAKVADAKKMLGAYGIKRVPSFVVGGKYLTSAQAAGGVPEMMKVIDYLVGRVKAGR
jgi:thiol:disulfide interchange protein DsbA